MLFQKGTGVFARKDIKKFTCAITNNNDFSCIDILINAYEDYK